MNRYLYYCKNCRTLKSLEKDDAKFYCEECGGCYYPLHVTRKKWDRLDRENKKQVIKKALKNKPQSFFQKAKALFSGKNNAATRENGFTLGKLMAKKDDKRRSMLIILASMVVLVIVLVTVGVSAISGSSAKDSDSKPEIEQVEDITSEADIAQALSESSMNDANNTQETTINDNAVDTVQSLSENIGEQLEQKDQKVLPEEGNYAGEQLVTMYATDKVKIRKEPNTDCDVLGMVNTGESVDVREIRPDGWSSVSRDGIDGYIKSEYLSDKSPSNEVAQGDTSVGMLQDIGNAAAASSVVGAATQPDISSQAVTSQNTTGTETAPPLAANMVWVTKSGGCYHKINDCGGTDTSKVRQITLDEAISRGLTPCSNCWN